MDKILNILKRDSERSIKLNIDSELKFSCHKGISCFNKCCSNIEIFLTPYCILRLKNRLGIPSHEFLLKYTETVIIKETKIPLIKIKMDENSRCPLNTDDGCTVYSDRPVACRYYPIGFGVVRSRGPLSDDFFVLITEDHCKGFEEEKIQTIRQWRNDQEINVYDDINKDWIDVILQKKMVSAGMEPDEKSAKMFFMGSYDIDAFRDFVFESKFFDIFDVDDEEILLIKNDESELLKFAHKWLQYVLYKKPMMFLKEGVEKAKK